MWAGCSTPCGYTDDCDVLMRSGKYDCFKQLGKIGYGDAILGYKHLNYEAQFRAAKEYRWSFFSLPFSSTNAFSLVTLVLKLLLMRSTSALLALNTSSKRRVVIRNTVLPLRRWCVFVVFPYFPTCKFTCLLPRRSLVCSLV